jgi:hypothetical protein
MRGLWHNLFDRRSWLFLRQRLTRGWDDSATWNLDQELSKLILPRLRRFREISGGRPPELTQEQWGYALLDMENAFKILAHEPWDTSKAEDACIDRGLKLFCEYYRALNF